MSAPRSRHSTARSTCGPCPITSAAPPRTAASANATGLPRSMPRKRSVASRVCCALTSLGAEVHRHDDDRIPRRRARHEPTHRGGVARVGRRIRRVEAEHADRVARRRRHRASRAYPRPSPSRRRARARRSCCRVPRARHRARGCSRRCRRRRARASDRSAARAGDRRAKREAVRRARSALRRRRSLADRRLHVHEHDLRVGDERTQWAQERGGFVALVESRAQPRRRHRAATPCPGSCRA